MQTVDLTSVVTTSQHSCYDKGVLYTYMQHKAFLELVAKMQKPLCVHYFFAGDFGFTYICFNRKFKLMMVKQMFT